jgi:hypothetical protein
MVDGVSEVLVRPSLGVGLGEVFVDGEVELPRPVEPSFKAQPRAVYRVRAAGATRHVMAVTAIDTTRTRVPGHDRRNPSRSPIAFGVAASSAVDIPAGVRRRNRACRPRGEMTLAVRVTA